MITSLDNNGQVTNTMEAFFKLEEKAIMLNYIEANSLNRVEFLKCLLLIQIKQNSQHNQHF